MVWMYVFSLSAGWLVAYSLQSTEKGSSGVTSSNHPVLHRSLQLEWSFLAIPRKWRKRWLAALTCRLASRMLSWCMVWAAWVKKWNGSQPATASGTPRSCQVVCAPLTQWEEWWDHGGTSGQDRVLFESVSRYGTCTGTWLKHVFDVELEWLNMTNLCILMPFWVSKCIYIYICVCDKYWQILTNPMISWYASAYWAWF